MEVYWCFLYVLGFALGHCHPAPFLQPDMWTSTHLTFLFKFVSHDQHWSWTSCMKEHLHLSCAVHKYPVIQYPRQLTHPPFLFAYFFVSCTCYQWIKKRLNLQISCNARCKLYLNIEFLFLFLRLFKPLLWRPQMYGIQCLAWCHISTNAF